MKLKTTLSVTLTLALACSRIAYAAIESSTTIDFGYSPTLTGPDTVLKESTYYGKANATPNNDGTCVTACVYQNGMAFGSLVDPSATAKDGHIHRNGPLDNRQLMYHSDSPGIYIRAIDLSAFSLDSMFVSAPIYELNPYSDPEFDYYEILGFDSALNSDLTLGNGTNYSNRVAYQTVANGFVGTLELNTDFRNISSIWIHYAGIAKVADINFPFEINIDNVMVSPAVTAVPLPASFWLFSSGLIALRARQKTRRQPSIIKRAPAQLQDA
jgi:hypothetical protein